MVAFGAIGSKVATASGSSVAVPYPSGIVAGAPMILVTLNSETFTYTTPTGVTTWTVKQSNSNVGSLSDLSMYVWTTSAAGTESGSLTVTGTGTAGEMIGVMALYTGAAATTPITTTAVTNTGTTAVSSSPSSLTALSPAPGVADMVVRIYGFGQDTKNNTETLTSPGGTWTTRLNTQTAVASAFQSAIVVADKIDGTDTQVITSNEPGVFMVVDVSIKNGAVGQPRVNVITQAVKRASYY